MKSTPIALSALISLGFVSAALADQAPPRSRDFTANYRTLVKNQKAAPPVADCIATAYDYVKKNRKYDRLGFTQDDISAASTDTHAAKFSKSDPRKVSAVISVPGEARLKSVGYKWDSVTLRCGLTRGKLQAIELAPEKSDD